MFSAVSNTSVNSFVLLSVPDFNQSLLWVLSRYWAWTWSFCVEFWLSGKNLVLLNLILRPFPYWKSKHQYIARKWVKCTLFSQVVQKHQLGVVGNKVTASNQIFSGIFLPKIIKSDSVWLSYGWWQRGCFVFDLQCINNNISLTFVVLGRDMNCPKYFLVTVCFVLYMSTEKWDVVSCSMHICLHHTLLMTVSILHFILHWCII